MVFRENLTALVVLVAFTSCGGGANKADPQQFAKDWRSTQAVNFTVYTPPNTPRPPRGIETYGKACDEIYDYVGRQLKLEVEDDIAIYLFTSEEDCKVATGRSAGFVEGLNIYTRLGAPVGGVIAEAICNSADREAKSFKLIRDGIRNLFDERDRNIHHEALAYRLSSHWPTLEDLINKQTAGDPEVYKFASGSYVAFLIQRYGTEQFHQLWRSNLELWPALEKIYGGTLPQMEEEWLRIQDKLAKRT
jgi:hypothetical protein